MSNAIQLTRQALLAPFFRASVTITGLYRRLFSRSLSDAEFFAMLSKTPLAFRQNISRILAAALVAEKVNGRIVFVEGWRSNIIERVQKKGTRVITGSRMSGIMLKMLQRRGLTGYHRRPLLYDISRCTAEETDALKTISITGDGRQEVICITETPCPSAQRVRRYIKKYPDIFKTVLTPSGCIHHYNLLLNKHQKILFNACRLTFFERTVGVLTECLNWSLHFISVFIQLFFFTDISFEVWLAGKLRTDKKHRVLKRSSTYENNEQRL